jgi:hypothetical protein
MSEQNAYEGFGFEELIAPQSITDTNGTGSEVAVGKYTGKVSCVFQLEGVASSDAVTIDVKEGTEGDVTTLVERVMTDTNEDGVFAYDYWVNDRATHMTAVPAVTGTAVVSGVFVGVKRQS